MSEDINKNLLTQFYGFNENSKETRFLSSSKGIESFEYVTDAECLSTENLLSSEETGKNQNTEEESEIVFIDKNEESLSKSPHVLEIEQLLEVESVVDAQDSHLETDIINDYKFDKNVPTKNLTRLEDTFTKAMAKMSDVPIQDEINSNENNTSLNLTNPVTKAKKLWRQKTMPSKENLLASTNFLKKFDGNHLNLNNAGICILPLKILQFTSLRILYLDSNNLREIPPELFTKLQNLKWLDIRNNQLITIPSTIKRHASLETLLLQGNNIQKLPLELGLIPNLKNLQTAHNPLVFPPQEILDLDCSKIINFLRVEWNKEHPNEVIQLRKIDDKIEKKPSTIICYQSTSKLSSKSSRYRNFQKPPKTSVRSKTWNYKPSSRCQNGGGDIALQQKMFWIKTAKKLLQNQASELQKVIDKNVLTKWRLDYKYSKNVYNNTSKRPLSTPFALHDEDSKININERMRRSKSGSFHLNYKNFNEYFNEFVESLKKLDNVEVPDNKTPYTEQKKLQSEIEKIIELQRKLKKLQIYNDSVIAPFKGPEDLQKKYKPPPSIII